VIGGASQGVPITRIAGPRKRPAIVGFIPGLTVLVVFGLLAALAPILPLRDPIRTSFLESNQPPSAEYWFGTDENGMDIFSRVIHAARIDLILALSAVAIGGLLGTMLGAVAGYVGGFLEVLIERISEMIQGFPYILLGLMISLLLGAGTMTLLLVVVVYNVPFYAKLVRSEVKALREAGFVQAAVCAGVVAPVIVFKHLVPNAIPAILGQIPLSCAAAIRFVAALSFLGLGIPPPTPEWGSMIQIGANAVIFGQWWIAGFPGLALFAVVWAMNSVGSHLQTVVGREA
jgi:peptide/nickel transport system permease protein